MFEIRIICDPADVDRATTALATAFTVTGTHRYATGKRVRLYATATTAYSVSPWPTPQDAYDTASSIVSEIGWVLRTAREIPTSDDPGARRVYLLRKAAVLDRIALVDEPTLPGGTTTDAAMEAAFTLLDCDQATTPANPRGYVRQQYQHWRAQEQRADRIAAGRCPNCGWPQRDCTCADQPNA